MLDGGDDGSFEILEIGGVGDIVGVGDRVDAGGDGLLKFREPLAKVRCKR
jgi:hypothetical protein